MEHYITAWLKQSHGIRRMNAYLWFSATLNMAYKSFTATALSIIKFTQQMKPATLLTRPLLNSIHYDYNSFGGQDIITIYLCTV